MVTIFLHSPHEMDKPVTAVSANVSLLEEDVRSTVCSLLMLLASERGLQHALDRFSAASDQSGM